jgi:hypothetical protein
MADSYSSLYLPFASIALFLRDGKLIVNPLNLPVEEVQLSEVKCFIFSFVLEFQSGFSCFPSKLKSEIGTILCKSPESMHGNMSLKTCTFS